MAQFWKELSKWHQRLIKIGGIVGFFYILFTSFRAGILFPFKLEQRMNQIEASQINISNVVEEVSYKQDRQHDLLIRIEERLWPERTVGLPSLRRNSNTQ